MTLHIFAKRSAVYAAALVLVGGASFIPPQTVQAADCVFTKDLSLGAESEEVRCLQKYLNANGFVIATTGVGSPGRETTQFKDLTHKALIKWQVAKGISPATGTFGPKSRAKYLELTAPTVPTTPVAPTVPTTPTTPTTPVVSSAEKEARTLLKKVMGEYQTLLEDIDDTDEDDREDSEDYALDAQQNLFSAFTSFLSGNFTAAIASAKDAQSDIEDAAEEIGQDQESKDKDAAKSKISAAKKAIANAQDDIDEADDDGEDIDDADDLLDDAREAYNDAWDAYDDEDWEEAKDLAQDALDLVEEALDEL